MQTVKVTLHNGHVFESPVDNIDNVKRMLAGQIKDLKLIKDPATEVIEAPEIKVTRGKKVTN